jgi:site-specific DNA recombinase
MKSAQAEGLKLLRAAIYARKSTDDNDRQAENKSVTRQIEHAKEYARRKGWTVDEAHVFSDDGISGAEFKNRPALIRMLNTLKRFDVIVMSELSRIGRDQIQTAQCLANIEAAGVAVEFYLTGERLKFDSAVDRFMANAVSFAAELEREKASQRSRDALDRRVRAGYNAGGLVYGYDNVPVFAGEKKSHTEYRINEEQAQVIRAMFRMYADGHGAKAIAYSVNGNLEQRELLKRYFGGARPAAPRGGKSWSANTIHDLLRNPRYLGLIPYGATRKKYIGGTKKIIDAPEQLFPVPHLRIIDEKLAAEVKQRVEQMAKVYLRSTGGKVGGRPDTGQASRYLLSGLVRCESCGSAMVVSSSHFGSGKTRKKVKLYVCSGRHNRGPSTCSNTARPRLEALESEVLKAIDHHISPSVVRAAARRAVEIIRAQNAGAPNKSKKLRDDLKRAEAEASRFVAAIGAGGNLESLVAALAAAEHRRDALRSEVAEMESSPVLDALTDKGLEQRLRQRAAQWREVLTGDLTLARQGLRALLAGPIAFAPDQEGFRLRGSTRLGALWAPETIMKMASPREHDAIPHVRTVGYVRIRRAA